MPHFLAFLRYQDNDCFRVFIQVVSRLPLELFVRIHMGQIMKVTRLDGNLGGRYTDGF